MSWNRCLLGLRVGRLMTVPVLAAFLAGPGVSVGVAAEALTVAPNMAASPSVFDQLRLTGLAAKSKAPEHVSTAVAQADRAQSATRYGGLSASAAVGVLQERVPEVVEQPAFRPLDLPSDARVSGFADDDHLASLRTQDGQSLVLASSTPLRAIDKDSGLLAPVDLSLASQDGAFVPINDPVSVVLPVDLSKGITVGAVGVRLDGVRGSATGQQINDTVVWANALGDVDAVGRAIGLGAELSLVLRSESSPEAFPVSFDVPEGTAVSLHTPVPGGHSALDLIGRDGVTVGTLSAPVAWDADHVAVPAQWQVQDGKATLLVPHSESDIAWPIVVDPQIADTRLINDDRPAGYLAAHPWTWSNTPGFGVYYDTQMNQYTPYTNFADTTFSWWEVNLAGRQASILQIHADGESHSTSSGPVSCSYINIYYSDTGTEYPWAPDCSNYAGRSENVGNWVTPGPLHRGNKAIVGEYVYGPGVRWAAQGVTGLVLALRDDDLPAVTVTGPSSPSVWTNSGSVAANADDEGLGVKQFTLTADALVGWSGATTLAPNCLPTAAVCPTIVGTGGIALGNLPDGIQTVRASATDPTGHGASGTVAVKYDRTAPAIGQLTGTLYDNRDTSFGAVRAVRIPLSGEGSTASQPERRSGVHLIRLIVDGTNTIDQRSFAQQDSWVPSSTGTDNILRITGSALSLGSHTVVASVTDWAGNTRSSSPFSITTTPFVDTTPPSSTLSGAAVDNAAALNGGGWELDVHATDGTSSTPGSGVANVNLYIDDELNPDNDSQPQDTCHDPSNCTLDAEFVVDSDDIAPGPHDLKINTRDFAGNVSTKTLHVATTIDPDSPEAQAGGQSQSLVVPTPVCPGGPAYGTFYAGSAVSGNVVSYAQRTCSAGGPGEARHDTSYSYGTCSTTIGDAGCQAPLLINSSPLCERHAKLYQQPDGTQLPSVTGTSKGVPTASYNQGTVVEVYTGTSTITINAATATLATTALQALRPAPTANQPTYGAFDALPNADTSTVGSSSLPSPSASILNATSAC